MPIRIFCNLIAIIAFLGIVPMDSIAASNTSTLGKPKKPILSTSKAPAQKAMELKIRTNQETISVKAKNVTFRKVLYALSQQAGIGFMGDEPKLFMDKKLSLSFMNAPLDKGIRILAHEVGIKHINIIYTYLTFHGKDAYLIDKVELYYKPVPSLMDPGKMTKPGRVKPLNVPLFPISAYLPTVKREQFLPPSQALEHSPFLTSKQDSGIRSTPPPEILKKREEYKKRMMEEAEKKKQQSKSR